MNAKLIPILFIAVFCPRMAHAAEAEGKLTLKFPENRPEVFQRIELLVEGMPKVLNVFDPDSVSLDLEVTASSGKTQHVPGFFFRPFERRLENGQETLTAQGEGEWRIRWLPLETGRHKLVVNATIQGKASSRAEATVEVTGSKRPGLVRVEPRNRRYFCLDDGTPLFLKGLCACWYGRRGTYDYDDWLEAYQHAGINYIRLWMWPQSFGLEYEAKDRVNYHLDNAWRLDRVLAEAERRGIYVMLCLDYHGMFEVKPDYWGGNNWWPGNPYNATNGGPCQVQNDFFTSTAAKDIYTKRLHYLVARWSAFPNLLAWEFFNEIDNEYAYLQHKDVVAWHGEMGRRLHSLDPYQHLISSSFTGGSERPDLYALPEIDFAQYHSYNEKHPAEMMAQKTARFLEKYRKPFFVSEYGTDWKGWKPDTDPHLRALHQAIWSGAFTGAAGTGMTWWWESIHSARLYPHWSALNAFLQGTDLGRSDFQPARFQSIDPGTLAFGVTAQDQALVWLLDRRSNWPEGAMLDNPPTATGVKVVLTGLTAGRWSIEWWDTRSGKRVTAVETTATSGALNLDPPPFQADIAARITRH